LSINTTAGLTLFTSSDAAAIDVMPPANRKSRLPLNRARMPSIAIGWLSHTITDFSCPSCIGFAFLFHRPVKLLTNPK